MYLKDLHVDSTFDLGKVETNLWDSIGWNSSGRNSTGSNWSSNASTSTPKKQIDVQIFEGENTILDDFVDILVSKHDFLAKVFLCFDLQLFNEKFVDRLFEYVEKN